MERNVTMDTIFIPIDPNAKQTPARIKKYEELQKEYAMYKPKE